MRHIKGIQILQIILYACGSICLSLSLFSLSLSLSLSLTDILWSW